MRQVIILQGCSGSGKSTLASNLAYFTHLPHASVVSADNYFIDEHGKYVFNAAKLSAAHGNCFRNFIDDMMNEVNLIIIDNTNTTTEEVAPYILGAQAFGYEAEIRQIAPPEFRNYTSEEFRKYVETCAQRNKHGVSSAAISAQCDRLAKFKPMPWWKFSVVPSDNG